MSDPVNKPGERRGAPPLLTPLTPVARRRSVLVVPVALVAISSLLAGCGGGSSAAPKKHKPTTTTKLTTTTTTAPPVAPETGLPDPQGASLTRPALWVKIENLSEQVRPQAGLDVADVVYEQITEGGITRFIALFNSQIPDVVGPIRSTRAMDADVVAPLGGIFAYSGGIADSVRLINQAPVNAVDDTKAGPAMFRDKTRRAPHNLFGHADQLLAKGGKPVPPPPLFQYLANGEIFTGDPVMAFTVKYDRGYAPTYTFDAPTGTWKRDIDAVPFTATSGQHVAPTNVIVQFVPCCVPSPEGGAYQTVGSGDAWVFTQGKVLRGKWNRTDRSQVTQFVDAAGAPVKLAPGRTWVEFAPIGLPVDVISPPPPAPPPSS